MEQHETLATLEAAIREPSCPLHFTPVLMRARIDGWTEGRQRRFVAALAATGQVGRAAAIAGMSDQSLGRVHAKPDSGSFRAACAAASLLAKRARRIRADEARKAAKGAKAIGGVSERRPTEPRGPDRRGRAAPGRGSATSANLGTIRATPGEIPLIHQR